MLPITPPPNACEHHLVRRRSADRIPESLGGVTSDGRIDLASLGNVLDFIFGYVMGEKAATRAASHARNAGAVDARAFRDDINQLDERIDRLLLVVDAMWSILKEHGYNDEQLIQRIRMMDMDDGVADGKRLAFPQKCTKCDALVEPGRPTCTYCGAVMSGTPNPFDKV